MGKYASVPLVISPSLHPGAVQSAVRRCAPRDVVKATNGNVTVTGYTDQRC